MPLHWPQRIWKQTSGSTRSPSASAAHLSCLLAPDQAGCQGRCSPTWRLGLLPGPSIFLRSPLTPTAARSAGPLRGSLHRGSWRACARARPSGLQVGGRDASGTGGEALRPRNPGATTEGEPVRSRGAVAASEEPSATW